MKIAVACDHAGFEYKGQIIDMLTQKGYQVTDYGTNSAESCDYPDYALPACHSVANGENQYAILVCGTGVGMSIVANKVKGIRCALCTNEFMALSCREHNNANVLALGQRVISVDTAKKMVEIFLTTDFAGGRHLRRVDKITDAEKRD